MKALLYLFLICSTSVIAQPPIPKDQQKYYPKETFRGNKKTDDYINRQLNSKLLMFDKYCFRRLYADTEGSTKKISYTLRYDSIEITAVHYLFAPYEQKEHWEFYGKTKDGSLLLIDSPDSYIGYNTGTSDKTRQRIKDIINKKTK